MPNGHDFPSRPSRSLPAIYDFDAINAAWRCLNPLKDRGSPGTDRQAPPPLTFDDRPRTRPEHRTDDHTVWIYWR
jgi:hypothetical protein